MPQNLPSEHRRPWSVTDQDKLMFWWGTFKLSTIAARLNRTPWAVTQQALKLKLGAFERGNISMRKFSELSGYNRSQILKAAKRAGIKLHRATPGAPVRSRPRRLYAITDDQQEALLKELLSSSSTHVYIDKIGDARTTKGRWGVGKKPAACLRCGTSSRPHVSKGLCASCYNGISKRNKKMNDTNPILRFTGMYRFLSNFYPAPIEYEGKKYYSLEHAYQATKTTDVRKREPLTFTSGTALSTSPNKAKSWGRAVTLRSDWEDIKMQVMEDLLRLKFSIPQLRAQLLETNDRELIEGNSWNDRFWGRCELDGIWEGENHLGKLLMKVRAEIRNG